MKSLTAKYLASLQGKKSLCLHAVFPASTFFRAIPADIHQAIGQTNNFSKKNNFVVRGQIRNTVVDSQCTPVEWASSSLAFPISDHNNRRCQKRGMRGGGIMQQTQNSYQVDSRGGFSPHKHFRAKGSPFHSEIVCKSSNHKCAYDVQNRQHTCSSLHQSSRGKGNKVCRSVQSSSGARLHQSLSSLRRASPRNSQPGCRPSFAHFQRSHRVDDKSTSPQGNIIITSSKPINRHVCFSSEQTVSNLLQLETRSRCMEDRCLQFPMDTERLLCFPTILPGGKSSSKSHTRQVSESSSCDTFVAFSTMVSPSEKSSHYTATISERNKTDFTPSSLRGSPPLMETAEANCMGCLRRQKK